MSHCIRVLGADRLFLSNKEPRHSNFQQMDLQEEFSILSTAGTRLQLLAAVSGQPVKHLIGSPVGHYLWDTPGWEQGARLLPCQHSRALAAPCREIQAHRDYVQKFSQCTTESPVHKELLIPPSSQPCMTLPYWPVHSGFTHGHSWTVHPQPKLFCAF